MAWLGEEMVEKPADAVAPRCVKDVIEEKLFDRKRHGDRTYQFARRPIAS